jgi:hypothetical protein
MREEWKGSLPYSDKVGKLQEDIERYKREYIRMWWETTAAIPSLGRRYEERVQESTAKKLLRFIDHASRRLDECPSDEDEKKEWMEDFLSEIKKFARNFLDGSELYLDAVFQEDYVRSTQMFIDKAKEFDPQIAIEDLYQALRNAWIMNSLQMYLGLKVRYRDSIFAYSMIYPYMDNYLDDTSLSLERKLLLVEKLKEWLEGQEAPYESSYEEKIFKLIKLIEEEYDRAKFPGVYQSLLSIFNAQLRSLIQQKGHILPFEVDILDLSFEKGGTSVLADGYLVAGSLKEREADFCFGFGAFLQFADDIQDIVIDKKNNHTTIFSLPAGRYPLDNLASKLSNFISKVVDTKLDVQNANEKILRELILRNCSLLILEAIGKNGSCFSKEFGKNMQRHFPIPYRKLKKLRMKLKNKLLGKRKHVVDLDLVSAFLLTATSRIIYGK